MLVKFYAMFSDYVAMLCSYLGSKDRYFELRLETEKSSVYFVGDFLLHISFRSNKLLYNFVQFS